MIIYLRMLPLSLERDDTIWRRIDDSGWSFPFAWSFPCFLDCTLSFSSFCYVIFLLFDLDILVLVADVRASPFEGNKIGVFCLTRGGLHPTFHQHPSLSFRKTQCYVVFDVTHNLLICSSTSSSWFISDTNSSLDLSRLDLRVSYKS